MFIETGTPIGSRTLVKSYDLGLSSATIRNVMSDLEDLGYLNKTHQSSGRVPSIKALRLYISNIISEELENLKFENRINEEIANLNNKVFEKSLSKVGKLLNDMTDYASLTFITKDSNRLVKEIFIKEVSEDSYIFVIMLSNDEIYSKLIYTNDGKDFIGAEKFNRFLKENFKNRSTKFLVDNLIPLFNLNFYSEISSLERMIEEFKSNEPDELEIYGMSKLLEHPDFDEIDEAKKVIALMKDDTQIRDLLSHDDSGGIKVYISDNDDDPLSSLSIITSTYRIDNDRIASFGVISPIRINYSDAITTIIELDNNLNKIFL